MSSRLLLVSLGLAACAHATTIHVPADQPTIQAGIDAAAAGDTVLVAAGTYAGAGNRDLDFGGVDRVLRSESGAAFTSIDPSGGESGAFDFANGESAASVVDGFTVRPSDRRPGPMLISISGASPTIRNCTFADNRNNAIYCSGGSAPTITHCRIEGNSTEVAGAGILCSSASPTITHCTIADNSTEYYGGGITCISGSPTISNCRITGNETLFGPGGGIYCHTGGASPTISNCIIVDNTASSGGGIECAGFASPTITHCTIAHNRVTFFNTGEGIQCSGKSTPTITNCIVWGSLPKIVAGGNPSLTYCNVDGGYPGAGNIDSDPIFRSYQEYDYVLWPGSPCIDAGTGADDGISWSEIHPAYGRRNGRAPDMGAYGGPGNVGWLP